jgi:tetratricopeptide (TPR) repeat protein
LQHALRVPPAVLRGGAAATREHDGRFTIAFTTNGGGRWLPTARERLTIVLDERPLRARVVERTPATAETTCGFGAGTTGGFRIALVPDAGGTTLTAELPRAVADRIAGAIDRALKVASAIDAIESGLVEPNLATWRLAGLADAASATADPADAAALLRRAVRLPGAPAALHARLAAFDAATGDHDRALDGYRRALLAARDPAQRAEFAACAAAAERRLSTPMALRRSAERELLAGDATAAAALLHRARRSARSPAVDYRLLGRVHRQRGDAVAALAAELLARENEPSPALVIQPAWSRHLADWSRRLALGIQPLMASAAPPR